MGTIQGHRQRAGLAAKGLRAWAAQLGACSVSTRTAVVIGNGLSCSGQRATHTRSNANADTRCEYNVHE